MLLKITPATHGTSVKALLTFFQGFKNFVKVKYRGNQTESEVLEVIFTTNVALQRAAKTLKSVKLPEEIAGTSKVEVIYKYSRGSSTKKKKRYKNRQIVQLELKF